MPFYMAKGDRRPLFVVSLVDDYGEATEAPVNLTTAGSAGFAMRVAGTSTQQITRSSASITNAAQGEVTYTWGAGQTDTAGTYEADVKIWWNDGKPETFPNSKASGDDGTKYWKIIIEDGQAT